MRATLLASAPAVSLNLYLTVLRSDIAPAHRRRASLCPLAVAKRRAGAHHPELAQAAVAPILVMRPSRCLPPVELWRGVKAEEGGKFTPAGEGARILNRGQDRRGGDRTDAGNGHQPPSRFVGPDRRGELLVDRPDRRVERSIWRASGASTAHTQSGTPTSPLSLTPSTKRRLRPYALCAPCAATTPISARCPRKALSAAVRGPDRSSRVRWPISSAWLSIKRTGANRWPGRPAAWQIAAASAASFLFRLTYGFTCAGGISLASKPSAINCRAQ